MEEDVFEFDDKKLADHHIQTLPGSLGEAASLLEESKLMRETLGERLHSKLVEAQKSQYNEYSMRVTPWELERYLPIL